MAFVLTAFPGHRPEGVFEEELLCPAVKRVGAFEFLGGVFQPSVTTTSTGRVMVFAQGRVNTSVDGSDKVVVYNYSDDNGRTWSEPRFLTEPGCFWGIGTYVSRTAPGKEKISVMFTYGKKELFRRYNKAELKRHFNIDKSDYAGDCAAFLYRLTSTDDGKTWQGGPLEANVMGRYYGPDQKYLAFFSPIGQTHVIKEGPWQGRYIIAGPIKENETGPVEDATTIYDYNQDGSCLVYSDDKGESWHFAGAAPPGGNEASAVAINRGRTIMMVRRRNEQGPRIVNYSDDCGQTWTQNRELRQVPRTRCLGVMKEFGDALLLSVPEDNLPRSKGWIGYSRDNGETWQGKTVQKGLFSYSDFTRLPGGDAFIVAYSHGHHGELGLYARRFSSKWLFGM